VCVCGVFVCVCVCVFTYTIAGVYMLVKLKASYGICIEEGPYLIHTSVNTKLYRGFAVG